MTEFTIRIAGQTAGVQAIHASTKLYCETYLCNDTPDFLLTINEADIEFERHRSAQTDLAEGKPVRAFTDEYLETLALQRKLTEALYDRDTLLFHGSVVAVDGKGYLFTAKSGTGKSTHTRLWREAFGERAVMVNDDKPFLRVENGQVMAYGSPWNGKHGVGNNLCVPLQAICFLQRAQQNVIRPIPATQMLPVLMQQSQRPQDKAHFAKYLELIDALAGSVLFYQLGCNMEPEAAIIAYEGMRTGFCLRKE